MNVKFWFGYFFLILNFYSAAQDSIPAGEHVVPAIHKNVKARQTFVAIGSATIYTSSFLALNSAWYKDYPRSSFHTFNDSREWLQIDKVGHAWTAYTTGRLTSAIWKWAGKQEGAATLLGTGTSLGYMLAIEYLDGRSSEWGWSWADVAADVAGAGLYAGQQLVWHSQPLQLKFSSHYQRYPSHDLRTRANDLFGKSLPERLLKDYNAQAYWLSANINSLLTSKFFPAWLNISVGYGAQGLYGGYTNIAYNEQGLVNFNRSDVARRRQFYLAPDVDLTKIRTKSKALKTVLTALNAIKFPAPALELSSGKLRVRAIVF